MKIEYGVGKTKYGPGVNIMLTGNEVALAIYAWLVAHDVHIDGAATVMVNGELCDDGRVYVDPGASVVAQGVRFHGSGPSPLLSGSEDG